MAHYIWKVSLAATGNLVDPPVHDLLLLPSHVDDVAVLRLVVVALVLAVALVVFEFKLDVVVDLVLVAVV